MKMLLNHLTLFSLVLFIIRLTFSNHLPQEILDAIDDATNPNGDCSTNANNCLESGIRPLIS